MRSIIRFIALSVIIISPGVILIAQPSPDSRSDVSDKALIIKTTPTASSLAKKSGGSDIAALRKLADEYYSWRNENFPVFSSDSGLHTWDDKLTDYTSAKVSERADHVHKLLEQVRAISTSNWSKDDRIDWMLFCSQLEGVEFNNRVLQP